MSGETYRRCLEEEAEFLNNKIKSIEESGENYYIKKVTALGTSLGCLFGTVGGLIKFCFTKDPLDILNGTYVGGMFGVLIGLYGSVSIYDRDLRKVKEERSEIYKHLSTIYDQNP